MTSFGIADETQLTILTRILGDHCTEFGIANGDQAREEIGRRIMVMFNCSYATEQINRRLARPRQRRLRSDDYILSPESREEAGCASPKPPIPNNWQS